MCLYTFAIMKIRYVMLLPLIAGTLAGCGDVIVFGHTVHEAHPASEVKAEPTATPKAAVTPRVQVVKTVTLVLAAQAAAKVVDDSRFNADALLAEIKSELQSRKLLDDADLHSSGTAEISIDDYAMRPTSNVILFGNIISAGTLSGDVRVRDAQGNELPDRRIEAETRVSIPASGESANPLAPLYRQFAVMTANSLAGTPTKSSATQDQPPR